MTLQRLNLTTHTVVSFVTAVAAGLAVADIRAAIPAVFATLLVILMSNGQAQSLFVPEGHLWLSAWPSDVTS